MSESLYVIALDTIGSTSADIHGYEERTCVADYFRDKIVAHPKMICCKSKVAEACGLDIKLYFKKHKPGLGQYYRQGGAAACMQALQTQPGYLASNNGAATYLTIDPEHGLAEYTVCGTAYDDGKAPLSRGQLWGIQEMVNCAMDIFDFDPANIERGREVLLMWASKYRQKTWKPRSGCGGIDIYSPRN